MFRNLQRKNKELSEEECISILQSTKRGVLSVIGDEGYPYGMPMNHYYAEDGNIYFHCGKQGHRLDSIKACDKVSFCVYDEGTKTDGKWALTIRSVIVFGKIEVIDDADIITDISSRLSRKFTDDEAYIKNEIECFANETLILKLCPEYMCGKRIVEQ